MECISLDLRNSYDHSHHAPVRLPFLTRHPNNTISMHELCNTRQCNPTQVLRKKFPQYPVPVKSVPKTLLYLAGPYINPLITRKFVANNIDVALNLDNSKSKRELGIEYRPWDKAMISMFEQIIESGGVEKK
uniref:Uncharacterized protein n=1 Tax=Craspedostauros australis TaxID=1486917 RepID=A0A7R9WND7_9STRA|mmetsp:Transcript_13079/g.36119  ORF Transcript_13079/g.36119 Transcript_13079/m.36119 type:complete len:132 (+) Transcript_13079:70-465(+)